MHNRQDGTNPWAAQEKITGVMAVLGSAIGMMAEMHSIIRSPKTYLINWTKVSASSKENFHTQKSC